MRSNSELIQATVSARDSSAFAELIRRYERLVWTVAWRVLRDYHATQDVTQETFLMAHRKLGELQSPDSIGSWLSSIAYREACRVGKRGTTDSLGDLDWIPDRPRLEESDSALLTAVAELPDQERTVTVLRYLNGHSTSEVAELTGRPLGTVTKQLSRAVARLRDRLGGEPLVPTAKRVADA